MTEEKQTTTEDSTEEQEPNSSEIIEIDWDRVQNIWKIREAMAMVEEDFKRSTLEYEKLKFNLMAKIIEAQNALYRTAEALREDVGISKDLIYELKLPQDPGEKAYFIRKDS